jgi:PilZ domain
MMRRQHTRVRLRLPARLRWVAPLGQKTEQCETRNASRGGLLLACHEQHPVGLPLWVTFPFDPAVPDAQPELLARVLRCEDCRESGQQISAVAVHFESALHTSIGSTAAKEPASKAEQQWRALAIPVRIRPQHVPWFEEAMTSEVSKDTLRFVSHREYAPGDTLFVSFSAQDSSPWEGNGESAARVLLVECIPGSSSLSITARKVPS